MAFEGLAERLQGTMQKIKGKGKINEADVKEMMREVRLALLEAENVAEALVLALGQEVQPNPS